MTDRPQPPTERSREDWLDEIIERWEQLRSEGNELDAEALCEHDDEFAAACAEHTGLVEEADEEISKLRRFDSSFGDMVAEASEQPVCRAEETLWQDPRSAMIPFSPGESLPPGESPAKPAGGTPLADGQVPAQRIRTGTQLLLNARLVIESRFDGGGLGDIYRASDDSLRRPVAVKVIRNYQENRHYTRRFLREATVTAQLNAPGVIPIYGYGTAGDGQPFYVMRLIDGDGLNEKIKSYHVHRQSDSAARAYFTVEFQRLLRYFVSVCRTISYAHDMGVVHCDLKPQNIKIGKYDEVFVLDWGEATSYGSRLDVPRQHSGRISPAYAPPELSTGSGPPTPASDIYSLGMILYEILLGRRAVDDSPGQRETRLHAPTVPRPLASICLKAMESQRQARYDSVREMADDIERWLADEPVSVHRDTVRERITRSLRRYTTVTQIGVVCVTALLLLSAVLAVRLKVQNEKQRQAQIKTLMVSAGLSADSIAGEIDRRISFLEQLAREVASDAELLSELQDPPPRPPGEPAVADEVAGPRERAAQDGLMTWFNKRLAESGVPPASSWFVMDRQGVQQAKRVDQSQDLAEELSSLGRSFSYRDYFHGQGKDLSEAEVAAEPPSPVRAPYLCRRYTSSTTGEVRVALTVPVRDSSDDLTSPQVVGVIGMSFALDELSFVSHRLSEEDSLILVDTRAAADQQRPGLMVVHPGYRDRIQQGYRIEYQQLTPQVLAELAETQRRRRVQFENLAGDQRLPSVDNYLAQFPDPLSGTDPSIGAAYEPVVLRHRGLLMDTGLVVIVRGQRW